MKGTKTFFSFVSICVNLYIRCHYRSICREGTLLVSRYTLKVTQPTQCTTWRRRALLGIRACLVGHGKKINISQGKLNQVQGHLKVRLCFAIVHRQGLWKKCKKKKKHLPSDNISPNRYLICTELWCGSNYPYDH